MDLSVPPLAGTDILKIIELKTIVALPISFMPHVGALNQVMVHQLSTGLHDKKCHINMRRCPFVC